MTDVQFESGDDQILTTKYDSGCCFLPASSGYWRSYLFWRIQNGLWVTWSVRTGSHISWAHRGWRLHFCVSHECWVDMMMGNIGVIIWEGRGWRTEELTWGLPLQCIYFILCRGCRQADLTVETLLESTSACRWGYELNRKRFLSGWFDMPSCWWYPCYTLILCSPLCVKWWR